MINTKTFPKPINRMTKSDWEDYYADPKMFALIFSDYVLLRDEKVRHPLSSSQQNQLSACIDLIDGKMTA